jgi:NAD(P)-dependent dehydrogenase (short-subunit alcohol dehydrogenase family)
VTLGIGPPRCQPNRGSCQFSCTFFAGPIGPWGFVSPSPIMSASLSLRTAVVTGAGRGIGRATAIALANAGCHVVLVARTRRELDETAELVVEGGGGATVLPADLGDACDVARTLDLLTTDFATIDILINNAAVVWPIGPSASIDSRTWAQALNVNLVAVASLTFGLLPRMLAQAWGRIVGVSSIIACQPGNIIGGNAYATSKGALEAHVLNLAHELAGSGVTCNVFRPGAVDTAMQAWIRAQDPDTIGERVHRRFVGLHEEGLLIPAEQSAKSLIAHLPRDTTGEIWDVNDVI